MLELVPRVLTDFGHEITSSLFPVKTICNSKLELVSIMQKHKCLNGSSQSPVSCKVFQVLVLKSSFIL